MKPQINIYLSTDKPSEKLNIPTMPQTTKYSGHSKIKGFSFQMDSNNMLKDTSKNIEIVKPVSKPSAIEIFKIEDTLDIAKQKNTLHQSRFSHSNLQSNLLNNSLKQENLTSESDFNKGNGNKEVLTNNNIQNQNGNSIYKTDEPLNITDLIQEQNFVPLSKTILFDSFDKYETTRHSSKSLSVIKSFSANTHQGAVRKYNEDRVSIILNIVKPTSFKGNNWPSCSFFGVFDGHGGSKCADYLKDNLHNFIIKNHHFPKNPSKAIIEGFNACDEAFIEVHGLGHGNKIADRSGSCAIVVLIIDKQIFIANTGDSRAVMSVSGGINVLSNDHKPNYLPEKERITNEGGRIYQTQTSAKNFNIKLEKVHPDQLLYGPYRIFPGRLSVSRSFGDIEAKLPMFNGNPKVLISTPEVKTFTLNENIEWLVIACDGVYDTLSNEELKTCIDLCLSKELITDDIHKQTGLSVDFILKASLKRQTMDNITCVMLTFEAFEKKIADLKRKYSLSNTHKKINSNENSITNLSNSLTEVGILDKITDKKIRSANGMTIKKPISLSKNISLTSSIVSQDIKDNSQTTNSNYLTSSNNSQNFTGGSSISQTPKSGSHYGGFNNSSKSPIIVKPQVSQIESNSKENSIKSKFKEEIKKDESLTYVPYNTYSNYPTTTKNMKTKNHSLFSKYI